MKITMHLVVVLAVALGAEAQQPPPPKTPVFGAGVTLIAVPVFVTGRDGKSVSGLTADDFEVEADGKRTPIVSFQAVEAGETSVSVSLSDTAEQAVPVAVKAASPRQFLMLLDLEFSPLSGIVRVRKEAAEFITTVLAPGDLVAIAISNRAGLKVLTNFTSDHAFAARAISGVGFSESSVSDALGLGGSLGIASGSETRADEGMAEQDRAAMKADRGAYLMRVRNFVDDVTQLVKKISPLRGRKQIVLLSGGFSEDSWAPGSPLNLSLTAPQMAVMGELFQRAGEGDVVIHTINLAGIEGPIQLSSKSGRDDSLRGDTLSGGRPPTLDIITNRKAVSGRGTLAFSAGATGGRAVLPGNNFGQLLEEVEQISRHSYVIAFEAPDSPGKNDKPRKLKVRVRPPGLSVSHRPTYFSASATAFAKGDDVRLQAAEAISKGLNTGPLRLNLVSLPYTDTEGKTSIHVVLQIDGPAFVEAARGPQIAVQIYGYLMNSGRVLDSMALNTSIDLTKAGAALRESGLRIIASFPAPPGVADLRFSVRAGTGDATGSIQRNVTIPAFADGTGFLSAPMFTLPAAGRAVVPFQAKDRPPIQVPFHLGSERFVPDALATLVPGRSREVVVFAHPIHSNGSSPVQVTAEIGRAGQAFVPAKVEDVRVISDADGFDRIAFIVTSPDVASGSYVLRAVVRDPSSGANSTTEATVMVERGGGH